MENGNEAEKFFDPKEYSTKILGANEEEEAELPAGKVATLISLLTEPENKDVKEETLITLKKEKGGKLLLDAIRKTKSVEKKRILAAACWESEINFSADLLFFADLAAHKDYVVALEAITTIENMEGPFDEQLLKEAIKKIKDLRESSSTEIKVLLNDLVERMSQF